MDKQSCQREATNALFVNNAYTASRTEVAIFDFLSFFSSEDYSSIPLVETCSEVCHQEERCICSKCKCCLNCASKCDCEFSNHGADDSLARHLLPSISVEYMYV